MDELKINIRRADANDAPSLVKLNDIFNGVVVSLEDVEETLISNNEIVAVASIHENIVGFACAQYYKSFCYRQLHGEITELFMMDEYRRNGIGTLLISFLEDELKKYGVSTINVLTGNNNDVALNTYLKSEYSRTEEVLLRKKL